ncbi:MAG: hypothetical protein ACP5Q1_09470 [Anaerolineae bacterium]
MVDYKKLPDYMTPADLRKYFEGILDEIENNPNLSEAHAIDALWELADRQWHTYTLIAPDLAERIERFIERAWIPLCDRQDTLSVGMVLSIVGNLGLKRSYDMIKRFAGLYHDKTGQRIDEFIHRIEVLNDGKIEDPYYNLKRGR